MLKKLQSLFERKTNDVVEKNPTIETEKPKGKVSFMALATNGVPMTTPQSAAQATYKVARPMDGVIPKGKKLAMDSAITGVEALYSNYAANAIFAEGLQFLGYPYLAELTQRTEYRRPAEILANEMTRKWITIQCTGEEDKTAKIKDIEAEFDRLHVQKMFSKAAEQDSYFGRSHLYLDLGVDWDNYDELKSPLAESSAKVKIGSLKALKLIEPIWTYPNFYNAIDPISDSFFKPQSWFVMGKEIHATRLLTFVSRPVPDLLKPSYSFGGLSLSQMLKPYVDNWIRTRQSVSDLVHSFTVNGIKTNLSSTLNGDNGDELFNRMQLFNQLRDNRGLMILDKETEEFFNVSAPLSSLDSLQAQTQEHMSAAVGIPLIKLLGITPSGLNASSDGEMRSFYDWTEALQQNLFRDHIHTLLRIVQLSLYGEIDDEITFKFEPLWSLDESEIATTRKTQADTDAVYLETGVISNDEIRQRLANEPDSPYMGLDLNAEIEPLPDDEDNVNVSLRL